MKETPDNASPAENLDRNDPDGSWDFKLYVIGPDPRTRETIANLERICQEHFPGRYAVEIVDLAQHPERAREDNILAIPTLIRKLPVPLRKIIGTLRDMEKVLVGLDLKPSRPGVS